jgi:hypothetical protein
MSVDIGWDELSEFYRQQKKLAQTSPEERKEIFEVKDLRSGKFYWIKNEVLEKIGPVTGPYGVAVYNVLAYFCNGYERKSFPSITKICRMLGAGRDKVEEAIGKLENIGVIKVERQPGKVNVYYLVDISKRE